jgi:hypothetical protein
MRNLVTPTFGFRASPSIATKNNCASIRHNLAARHVQRQHEHHHRTTTTLLLSSPDEFPDNTSQEVQETTDRALTGQQKPQQIPRQVPQQMPRQDPLIASLTRIDGPTPENVPTTNVPFFGEIPTEGNVALLAPVAIIAVLGFLFSIVVAFTSREAIAQEFSKVQVPEMKYKATVVKEGQCRGLCSNQDKDLDGLRTFMEKISRREAAEQ